MLPSLEYCGTNIFRGTCGSIEATWENTPPMLTSLEYRGTNIFRGTCGSIKATWENTPPNSMLNFLKRVAIVFKVAVAGLIACVSFITIIPFAFPSIFNGVWHLLNGTIEPDPIMIRQDK